MEVFRSVVGKYPERDKLKEHNDCTVIAWAECFDSTYENAHAWLKKHVRRHRKGMYCFVCQAEIVEMLNKNS